MVSPPGMRRGPVDPAALGRLRRLPCDARTAGPSQNSLRAPAVRCARTAAISQFTRRVCPSAHALADSPPLLGGAEGIARPTPHAGLRVALTPSPLRGEGRGEGQCHNGLHPAADGTHRAANRCRRAAQRSRQRACRRTRTPRELTRRSCLSAAHPQGARSEYCDGRLREQRRGAAQRPASFERPGAYRPPPRPTCPHAPTPAYPQGRST